jgi:VanZ family protein
MPTMPKRQNQSGYSTICQLALAGYLLVLMVSTHLPRGTPFLPRDTNYLDKICHFVAYAVLAGLIAVTWELTAGALTVRHLIWALSAVAVLAALDEVTQWVVGRDCELADWVADVLGAFAGLFLFAQFRRRIVARKSELKRD